MNLNYSVLWFDDQQDFVESLDLDKLRNEIDSWGFKSEIDFAYTEEDFNKHDPFDRYDLIVVDYSLEGMDSGDSFIQKIRDHDIYTEIIFYSANRTSELWSAISEKKLEGIFVSPKANIIEKALKVAKQSVRKVLDLENMRGIVMSEVGDLDILLEEIFSSAFSALTISQQNDVYKKFYNGIKKQVDNHGANLDNFKAKPTLEELNKLCDSDKRWQNISRGKRYCQHLNAAHNLGNYAEDILWPRNCLAHGVPSKLEEGGYEFRFRGRSYRFDAEIGTELRQRILSYKKALSKIRDELTSKVSG